MAKLINTTRRDITLSTGHVVPRGGELATTNAVIRCVDNASLINALAVSGDLLVTMDADPEPGTRETAAPAVVPVAKPKTEPTKAAKADTPV